MGGFPWIRTVHRVHFILSTRFGYRKDNGCTNHVQFILKGSFLEQVVKER